MISSRRFDEKTGTIEILHSVLTVRTIELKDISPDNYASALALSVSETQKNLVAPVMKSLADAFVYKESIFKLAYSANDLVGYVLLYPYSEENRRLVNIVRLMIDQEYQGRGLGKKLLNCALEFIRALQPAVDVVRISTRPSNEVALNLYRRAGFVDRGLEDEEIALYMKLDSSNS